MSIETQPQFEEEMLANEGDDKENEKEQIPTILENDDLRTRKKIEQSFENIDNLLRNSSITTERWEELDTKLNKMEEELTPERTVDFAKHPKKSTGEIQVVESQIPFLKELTEISFRHEKKDSGIESDYGRYLNEHHIAYSIKVDEKGNVTELFISGSSIKVESLPKLPRSLKKLSVSNNILQTLPELPMNLEEISISYNQLETLPELPPRLRKLGITNNKLTSLPELPTSLEELNVYKNKLTELPELPARIKYLDAVENLLTALPDLPQRLEKIELFKNSISKLPKLPQNLELLSIPFNQLITLPELPPALKALHVEGNKISTLPNLPLGLEYISATHNPLSKETRAKISTHPNLKKFEI